MMARKISDDGHRKQERGYAKPGEYQGHDIIDQLNMKKYHLNDAMFALVSLGSEAMHK
jgi:hypothetical protein